MISNFKDWLKNWSTQIFQQNCWKIWLNLSRILSKILILVACSVDIPGWVCCCIDGVDYQTIGKVLLLLLILWYNIFKLFILFMLFIPFVWFIWLILFIFIWCVVFILLILFILFKLSVVFILYPLFLFVFVHYNIYYSICFYSYCLIRCIKFVSITDMWCCICCIINVLLLQLERIHAYNNFSRCYSNVSTLALLTF